MPTPTAIYRELMQDANREAVPMYVSTKKGQKGAKAKEASPETRKESKKEKSTTTLSRSLSRLKDTLTPGTMDPAPSPVDNATLGTPRRKRSTRKAAKTSPYFASRKSGLAKTSDTKQRENKGSGKKIKTLYVDESDEDGALPKKIRAADEVNEEALRRNQSVALKSISHPVKNHLKVTVLMDRRHHQVMMMILMRQISRTVMALI